MISPTLASGCATSVAAPIDAERARRSKFQGIIAHIFIDIYFLYAYIYMSQILHTGHNIMDRNQAALARKQLERRLAPLRDLQLAIPPRGWMRAIREALGMSTRQLAARMHAAPSRISTIEKAETSGGTTIKTLREAAEAMNCTFVYAFVPTKPLDDILRERAAQKAGQNIARLDHTMRLENQSLLKADLDDEQRRMIDLILAGSPRRIWEEN